MSITFEQMTLAERILYIQELWDRVAPEAEQQPLSPSQAAELDKRLAKYRAHPEDSLAWEDARQKIRRRK